MQVSVWKRQVRKMLRDGLEDGCKLPGTPRSIGKLLFEGSALSKSCMTWGRDLLVKNGFKQRVLYKWRNKYKKELAGCAVVWRQHGDGGGRQRMVSLNTVRKWRKDLPAGQAFSKVHLTAMLKKKVAEKTGQEITP